MRDAANTLIIFGRFRIISGIFDTRVMAVILVLFYAHFSYTMLKALILHFHPVLFYLILDSCLGSFKFRDSH